MDNTKDINAAKTKMSAKAMIELALSIGICIGKKKGAHYFWFATADGRIIEEDFIGTWVEFCRFIKNKAANTRSA